MRTLYLAALFIAFCFLSAFAQTSNERASLKALNGFLVAVEDISDEYAQRRGLTREQLQVEIELRLRRSGIQVSTTNDEWLRTPSNPVLYLNLNVLRVQEPCDGMYAFSIDLEVQQEVYLSSALKPSMLAVTWSKGHIGSVGKERLSSLRESVGQVVDAFINDYLAANSQPNPQVAIPPRSLPPVWKSLDNARPKFVTMVGNNIVITANLPKAEEDAGCIVLANLARKGEVYSGVENYECICTRRDPPHAGQVRRFQLIHQMELNVVTSSRIEGRIMREPKDAKFDCASGTFNKPASWRPFILIPN